MAYVLNKYNGEQLVVLQDGVLDSSTSLGLLGKNYTGYGEIQNENFVFLLENFAGINPPTRPIKGQTWYDSTNKKLNLYDGANWITVGTTELNSTAPATPALGAFWFNTNTKQLYVYTELGWNLIGPEGLNGFQETKLKAVVLRDLNSINRAVLISYVDGKAQYIISSDTFTINPLDAPSGFSDLEPGINIKNTSKFVGALKGNATTATKLETARTINGVLFDGTSNIVINAATLGTLNRGTYLTGNNFNGGLDTTWTVDATPVNTIGKIVARDSTGSFSAGNITAEAFIGPLSGNVTVNYGQSTFNKIICSNIEGFTFSGTAEKANELSPGRSINGVFFNGKTDITVPAAANTLTGSTLSATVKNTSIETLGFLTNINVADSGVTVGSAGQVKLYVELNRPTLAITNGTGLKIQINDVAQAGGQAEFEFVSSETALSLGGDYKPAFIGDLANTCNIGLPTKPFGKLYADTLYGVATSAQYADLAENYLADDSYEPGTVLEFGGAAEVTLAQDGTQRVAGVVTTNPAYLMNSKLQGKNVVALALQGRVPCKVRGRVKKGDMLQASGGGYARPAVNPIIGTIIGKSLEDFNGIEGIIEVAVGRL